MKCEHAQEFFSDYIEKTLDKPSGVALEAHLTACTACRHDLEGLRQTWGALNAVPMIEPPKDLAWRVMVQLQEERIERMEAERRRVNPFVAWLRALTPGAAFGYATLVALLLIAAVFPVRGVLQPKDPGTIFGNFGAVQAPTEATFAGAYLDSTNGRWFYRLVLTTPRSFQGGTVRVTPQVVVNGTSYAARERQQTLNPGQNTVMVPVPASVPEGTVQAARVRVEGRGTQPLDEVYAVPAIPRSNNPM